MPTKLSSKLLCLAPQINAAVSTLIRAVLFAMGSGKMQTKTQTVMRITNWLVKARETCNSPLIQEPSTEGIGWDAVFPA